MVVYTRLVIVVGASRGMEGSISYIVVSTRETNNEVHLPTTVPLTQGKTNSAVLNMHMWLERR